MHEIKVASHEELGADLHLLTFSAPHGYSWTAGQQAVFEVPHQADAGGSTRVLSIATAPFERKLAFVTHCPESGSSFKRAVRDLKVGDRILVSEAEGDFTYQPDAGRAHFVAAGVGAAAVRAILLDLAHHGDPLDLDLTCVSVEGVNVFRADFQELVASHPKLRLRLLDAPDLHEAGAIKEVEHDATGSYYLSAVYLRERLPKAMGEEHLAHLGENERNEVELLTRAARLE